MSSSRSKSFHKNSSDWHCADPACANLNFARRTECNRCKKPRELPTNKKGHIEIGQAAAKSSRGLFSADDWSCTKCGNINWARRNQCNICNAKKFVDEEERTGLGGGFNEREKVEYKQRRSSDSDEYDEFGRRKKYVKRKTSSSVEASNSRKSRRDRSSSSSSRSRSRSRSRRRHSSSSSSSTSSSSSSSRSSNHHRSRKRSRSYSPKRNATVSRKDDSRSPSAQKNNDDRTDNRNSHNNEKIKSPPSRSYNNDSEEEDDDDDDDDGGDLSKYNLFDDDDIDIEAFKVKK